MTVGAGALVTFIGLLLALAGVGCGVWAYVDTVRKHDTLPVWPWADRQVRRVRAWQPFRRNIRAGSGTTGVALAGSAVAVVSGTGSLTVIKADESLDERVARLELRLEQAEKQVMEYRTQGERAEARLLETVTDQGQRLDAADEQLHKLTKSVAVSSARLQLIGLILVGLGTMLMAVPTIAAAL